MQNLNIIREGNYKAKNISTSLVYTTKKNSITSTKKIGNFTDNTPYGLKFFLENNQEKIWDISSFRPDIRDNEELMQELQEFTQVEVMVLFEPVIMIKKVTSIPRYILWENDGKIVYFINIR
jgi:hypothetical protein